MQPESTPPKTTPPPPPVAPSADDLQARIAELEHEADRIVIAAVRLWSKLNDMKKEG